MNHFCPGLPSDVHEQFSDATDSICLVSMLLFLKPKVAPPPLLRLLAMRGVGQMPRAMAREGGQRGMLSLT